MWLRITCQGFVTVTTEASAGVRKSGRAHGFVRNCYEFQLPCFLPVCVGGGGEGGGGILVLRRALMRVDSGVRIARVTSTCACALCFINRVCITAVLGGRTFGLTLGSRFGHRCANPVELCRFNHLTLLYSAVYLCLIGKRVRRCTVVSVRSGSSANTSTSLLGRTNAKNLGFLDLSARLLTLCFFMWQGGVGLVALAAYFLATALLAIHHARNGHIATHRWGQH